MSYKIAQNEEPKSHQPFDPEVRRGPEPQPPKLEFRKTSWKWYYRRQWHSMKLPFEMKEEAKRRFKIIEARILEGKSPIYRPGEQRFKDVIKNRLAWLKAVAVTDAKLAEVAQDETASEWWLRFFGNYKLQNYRPKMSDAFVAAYVRERTPFYLKRPKSRRLAANGAATYLSRLRKFLKLWATDEETGWCPSIKVPKRLKVAAGRVLERSEQARMLMACRGAVWDHALKKFKRLEWIDENGNKQWTYRIRPASTVRSRKAHSRIIRAGVRTGAREEVYSEVVWGPHRRLAHFAIDNDGGGEFRRRGTGVPDSHKKRPTSPVPDRLRCLLRIWLYEDGHGYRTLGPSGQKFFRPGKKRSYVFGQRGDLKNDEPFRVVDLSGIVKDAGLEGTEISEHALRYTAVDEAHEMGFTLDQTSELLGMSREMLLRVYTDWSRRKPSGPGEALVAANSREAAAWLRAPRSEVDPDGEPKRHHKERAERLAEIFAGKRAKGERRKPPRRKTPPRKRSGRKGPRRTPVAPSKAA